MEELLLVSVKHGHIQTDDTLQPAVQRFRELHDKHDELYVIDYDGIKYNRSNLDIYKKISRKPYLWIDAFPRRTEDFIDLVVAGAKRITASMLMDTETLREVRNIYEGELYLRGDNQRQVVSWVHKLDLDGAVLLEPSSEELGVPAWGVYPLENVVRKIE